jgi:hypothetical protein
MNGCGLQQYGWSRRLFFDANMGIHKLSLPKVDCIVLSVRVVAFKVSFCQTRCCLLVSKVFFSVPELGVWTCLSNVLESTSISDRFKVAQLVFKHRSSFFFSSHKDRTRRYAATDLGTSQNAVLCPAAAPT